MTSGLHIHFVLNMHTKVHINWMLLSFVFFCFFFISINWMLLTVPSKTSCFAYNFEVQKYSKFKCVL